MHVARGLLTGLCVMFLLAPARAADATVSIENAIQLGIAYLKKNIPQAPGSGEAVLGGLALVKAGVPADDPAVQLVLRQIEKRCAGTDYKPHTHHYYVAGLEMMLLETVDVQRYHGEMEKILAYILKGQLPNGAWYYPHQNGQGDTSITQYAALGLWSAERAGLDVPRSAWDRMAVWHLKTQLKNGAFTYHPGEAERGGPNTALTLGGAANLLLARLHLFGDKAREESKQETESPEKRYGILEAVELEDPLAKKRIDKNIDYNPKSTAALIERSVVAARNWSAVNFRLPPPTEFQMYYLYALERMAALGNIKNLGPYDWYAQGAQFLVKTQQPDGAWAKIVNGDRMVSAAFGVLFLTRSTAKMLGRGHGVVSLGSGMLIGGRGLPNNLDAVQVVDGKIEKRGEGGPIDELLARLASAEVGEIPETQNAILEAVRFGDRDKLLNQIDRVRKLVADPQVEVRRTAFWVLGRAGDLTDVPRLINGLSDPDIHVAIEAHNALCVLSRRPLGLGILADPLAALEAEADDQAREQAIADWRMRAIKTWSDWYKKVAPYEQRGGLGLFH